MDATAKQPESLPAYESPHSVTANKGLNGHLFSGFPAEIGMMEGNEGVHTQQRSFLHLRTTPPLNLYPDDQLFLSSHRQVGEMTVHERTIPPQKKFFIFDHSGAETQMILSSLRPPIASPTAAAAKPVSAYKFLNSSHVLKSEQACPEVHDLYESHEDHIIGEASDYHEDTEEINALLYSDNDDINDTNCDGGNEDELSTGRSPLDLENDYDDAPKQGEDSDEEVTSFVHPPKRQKGSVANEPTVKLPPQVYEDESVVDVNTYGEESFPSVGTKRTRDKIRNKLRILEKLIPGSQSKDPLAILEEAIDYLKSLKVKANSLHVEGPGSPSFRGACL